MKPEVIALGTPSFSDRAFARLTPKKRARSSGPGGRTYVVLRDASIRDIFEDRRASACLIWDSKVAAVRRELLRHELGARVVERLSSGSWLSAEEIVDALLDENRAHLIIGVDVDHEDRVTLLTRGTLEQVVVPFDWYEQSRSPTRPDFRDAGIEDGGQTVRLGKFEAAAEAILYDFDADYRRAAKRRRIDHDDSLGGAIRRLRLSRGLTRSDFGALSEKTLARIERNESGRPRRSTLALVAKRLGVSLDELASY